MFGVGRCLSLRQLLDRLQLGSELQRVANAREYTDAIVEHLSSQLACRSRSTVTRTIFDWECSIALLTSSVTT